MSADADVTARDARPVPDRIRVHPAALAGTVQVPGDKSLSHRALIVGALASDPVRVSGLTASEDVRATAAALRLLGAKVTLHDAGGSLEGEVAGPLSEATEVVDCGNSGTSLRHLAGVAAGLDGLTVLTGDASLRRRPVDRVIAPLAAMGATLRARAGNRLPPLVVEGGRLRGTAVESPVASAQVKTAVLLAGLRADGATEITSPHPSRDHTERLLAHLGVEVTSERLADGRERVTIVPGTPRGGDIAVSGDPSSAAFWLVAGACRPDEQDGAAIVLPGLCLNPTRLGAVSVLKTMGAQIDVVAGGSVAGEETGELRISPSPLAGAVVAGADVVDALDELVVLAVAGALSRDGLEVRDATELRVKESDRIAALVAAFHGLGLEIEERPDGYRVPGGQRPSGGEVDAHGDHRIAMAAAVAATLGTAAVEIRGFATVGTSYPSFLADLELLGGTFEALDAAGEAAG